MKIEKSKIEVFLTTEIKNKLRDRANKHGTTMSEIIKRMLEEYLNK
jgi:hypothetical protein